MNKTQHIMITDIRTDGMQTRAAINVDVVREYAEAEREHGAVLPPVVVFRDSEGKNWLADGFHRLAVARQNVRKKVAAEVREGSRVDALRFALGANGAHGLRRTNADKAHAVRMAYAHRMELGLGEVPSANAVAELVGVSDHFVTTQLRTVRTWREATERVGADGKVYSLPPVPVRRPTENGVSGGSGASACGAALPPPPVRVAHAKSSEDGGADSRRDEPPSREAQGGAEAGAPAEAGPPLPPPPTRPGKESGGPLDCRGRAVPPQLALLWNRRGECAELARAISRVRCALRDAQNGGDPLWMEMNYSSALAHLDRAYTEIAAAQPWCVCPMCQGFGCRACKGRGLLGESRFEMVVPRAMR